VAGIVNVVGFLAVQRLTTNVTGHFAYFVDEIFKLHITESFIYFFYILSFFLGSFFSSFLIEITTLKSDRYIFFIPIIIESFILFAVASFGGFFVHYNPNVIAFCLLFAMGLQNSLVTRISNAVVRTTHLTGLFTDLGIELSQLFFYKKKEQKQKLISTINLRLRIILFFFMGGFLGGTLYSRLHLFVMFLPAALLILGLYYDYFKYKLVKWKRNYTIK
jgi:uncharacterized membrane protein YoaK (UPF0700 family)